MSFGSRGESRRESLPADLRRLVRDRAGRRCEYCRKPEAASLYKHHVDHIIALKHAGGSTPDNLAWACFRCNVSKGSNIAGVDVETGELTPLYHPRKQRWSAHFRLDGVMMVGRTAVGRVTVAVLNMNHASQIEARRLLMDAGQW